MQVLLDVFVVLIILTWQIFSVVYFGQQDYLLERAFTVKKPQQYDVVVGILSARANFEQRQALRDTWLGHITRNLQSRLLAKFVVASRPCTVPPQDRPDPYTCKPDVVLQPVLDRDITAFNLPGNILGAQSMDGPMWMDFRVNAPVVITHLGVFDSGLQHRLSTVLYNRLSHEAVVSTNFTPARPGQQTAGYRFKEVDQYVLPKGFEASIRVENFSEPNPSYVCPKDHCQADNGGGLLTFLKGHHSNKEETIKCAAGNVIYRAYDPSGQFSVENLALRAQEAKERAVVWKEHLKWEERLLEKEVAAHSDILLVDEVEVYRNLPGKMLHFYKWADECTLFNFTLKTDDDCFINVDAVMKVGRKETALEDLKLRRRQRIWWSNFRDDWLVDRSGKWREPDYSAPVYPSFACGAGNMLSADLVHWLAQNINVLKTYQGEDTSLGIWMAALGPDRVKDHRWSCGQNCQAGMYSSPDHGPEEIGQLWENLQRCGDPCGCS